jgi:hypothetical protein
MAGYKVLAESGHLDRESIVKAICSEKKEQGGKKVEEKRRRLNEAGNQ